jgi:hypothetical protein
MNDPFFELVTILVSGIFQMLCEFGLYVVLPFFVPCWLMGMIWHFVEGRKR